MCARSKSRQRIDGGAPARNVAARGFASIALVLAAVGLFGVLAFYVAQHMQEFGVRLALGATPRGLLGLVIRRGLVLLAMGIAIGLPGALAMGRGMSTLLYGVEPRIRSRSAPRSRCCRPSRWRRAALPCAARDEDRPSGRASERLAGWRKASRPSRRTVAPPDSNTVTPLGRMVPRLHYERFQRTR